VREVLEDRNPSGAAGAFRGNPATVCHGTSNDSIQKFGHSRGAAAIWWRDPQIPRGLLPSSRRLGPQLRILAIPPRNCRMAIDLARAFPPATTIILKPCRRGSSGVGPYSGPPPRRSLTGWKKDIARNFAKCPETSMSSSAGVGMTSFWVSTFHERDVPTVVRRDPRRGVAPIYRALHRSFSAPAAACSRAIYPPDKQSGGYTELWECPSNASPPNAFGPSKRPSSTSGQLAARVVPSDGNPDPVFGPRVQFWFPLSLTYSRVKVVALCSHPQFRRGLQYGCAKSLHMPQPFEPILRDFFLSPLFRPGYAPVT